MEGAAASPSLGGQGERSEGGLAVTELNLGWNNEGEGATVSPSLEYKCSPKIYTDDLMNGISSKGQVELISAMKLSCTKLGEYCAKNFLQLNSNKTHFLYLETPQRHARGEIEELVLGTDTVEATGEERVLGVIMTDKLGSWRAQVESIVKFSGEKLNALRLGCKPFPFKKRLEISKSVDLSKFFYGVEVWGPGLSKSQIKNITSMSK